jgi:hypothetical protein
LSRFGRKHGAHTGGRGDYRHVATHEVGCQAGKPIVLEACPAILNRNIPPLGETGFVQPLAERCLEVRVRFGKFGEKTDDRHPRLLRARCERPRRRRATERG